MTNKSPTSSKKLSHSSKMGKDLWPLGESQYYLGHVPSLRLLFPGTENERKVAHWYNASIKLASRFSGDLQRKVARHWDERMKT